MKPTLFIAGIFSFLLAVPPCAGAAKRATQPVQSAQQAASTVAIEAVIGMVRVKMSAGSPPVAAVQGTVLPEGAEVVTMQNSRAMIRFSATDIVRLGPNSRLIVSALPEPGKQVTLLRLVSGSVRAMLRRAGVHKADFAISAGGAVCAVKGTVVSIATLANGDASFTVDNGTAQVFKISRPDDMLAAFNSVLGNLADQKEVTVVKDGFQVTASPAAISKAVMAPPNPTLEVVSGSVKVTVDGVTTVKVAGDVIPSGAKVESSDGAVLQGSKITVDCPAGSSFDYSAKVTGNTLSSVVTPVGDSAAVVVGVGQTMMTVGAGDSLSVTKTPQEQTRVRALTGSVEMTNAAGETRTIAAPPPAAGGETPGATNPPSTVVINEAPIDLPPPPPETVKQDAQEVSPVAPKK